MSLAVEIVGDHRIEYAAMAAAWGYPRAISGREITQARWFRNGAAIVWFDRLPDSDTWAVHGIRDPDGKGQALTRETEAQLCEIARLLGARKLYSLIPRETPNMPVLAMRRYLRRYGWSEDEFGSYKLLGGA